MFFSNLTPLIPMPTWAAVIILTSLAPSPIDNVIDPFFYELKSKIFILFFKKT